MFLPTVRGDDSYAAFLRGSPENRDLARRDPEAAMSNYLDALLVSEPGITTTGFKLMYKHISAPLEVLIRRHRPRVIHLRRDNLLKRHVSEVAALARDVFHLRPHEEPPTARVEVPVGPLLANLRARAAAVYAGREFAGGFEHIEVSYEELVADRKRLFDRVFDFLGVAPFELPPAPIRKVDPDDLAAIVANYDEVAAALRGTEFEADLD